MESAIKTVVSTYLKSAKGKESLSGKDFQSMVKNQLGNILSSTESSNAVKELQMGLDDNQDGKVGFQEYMKLIGYLANSISEQYVTDKGKANNDGAVTQSGAPAEAKAEPAEEEPAAAAAAPAANGEAEAEKPEAEEGVPAAEKTAEEEKTDEEAS